MSWWEINKREHQFTRARLEVTRVCVRTCGCEWIQYSAWECTYPRKHTKQLEKNTGNIPPLISSYCLKTEPLTEHGAVRLVAVGPRDHLPVFCTATPVVLAGERCTQPFYVGPEDLNSGPQVCTAASTLPTD